MRTGLWCAAAIAAGCVSVASGVDPLVPPANRVGGIDGRWWALTGATVRVDVDRTVSNATLVVRDGVVVSVEPGGAAPTGARVVDGRGLFVYPGFIDPFVEVDAPRPDAQGKGAHWNYHVTPQRRALDGKGVEESTAEGLRKLGFVAAGISPRSGVLRGMGAAVSLAKPDGDVAEPRPLVYGDRVYHAVGFEGATDAPAASDGRWGGYPGSQMGAIALIRQTLIDAADRQRRVSQGQDAGTVSCLDALSLATSAPAGVSAPPQTALWFVAGDELETLRAWAIADEFSRSAVVVGSGTEYKRLEPIAARKTPLVVPLNFPEKPKVAGIGDLTSVELRELMSWEQGPTNPRRLAEKGVAFSLTTAKLRDRAKFRENLRLAIRHGLSERDALAALTVRPARLLGVESRLGTIEPGKAASFVVTDGPVFERKTKLLDVYCDGVRHVLAAPSAKVDGVYELTLDPAPPGEVKRFITIDADGGVTVRRATREEKKEEAKPEGDGKEPPAGAAAGDGVAAGGPAAPAVAPVAAGWRERSVKAKSVVIADDRLSFVFDHGPVGGPEGVFTHAGLVVERDGQGRAVEFRGDGLRASGEAFRWSMRRVDSSAWLGVWRVTEHNGKAKPAADKSQIKVEVSHTADGLKVKLTFTKEKGEPVVIDADDVKLEGGTLSFTHGLKKLEKEGEAQHKLTLEGEPARAAGQSVLPGEDRHAYVLERAAAGDEEPAIEPVGAITGLPFGPYARAGMPEQIRTILFVGGTVWTSGPQGIIEDCDVVVQGGKITAVGNGVGRALIPVGPVPEGVLVVDCRGKHVTPGLIDCHSHTGISRGVNEGGQAVTAEVRIGDVTNPDAINWYRQLAGGITTVNSLHGSANAIGGQNQVNKVRWGAALPNQMHFEGATPGIKFALGENPKWGNGEREGWRYPQTRMGVEALIRDRFVAARAYAAARAADGSVRRDLELEALAEILEGKRLIHCHSYRQDEILMLGNLAKEFGFKIGTYQHILEGYKVAEVVRDTSLGGSCFSDWWAYKVEVQDAIPQGGPIMHEQGAVVSFNSDSDEMARRMNVEAAKARKYARLPDGSYTVTRAQALEFVTINPAKQLKIEQRVGSIEVGKDADVAVWSGDPLSALSRCERTFVDGRAMFSLEDDKQLRERDNKERQRLIQKVLADKSTPSGGGGQGGGTGGAAPAGRRRPPNLLMTMLHQAEQERIARALDMVRRGYSTDAAARGGAGACGCDDLDDRSER